MFPDVKDEDFLFIVRKEDLSTNGIESAIVSSKMSKIVAIDKNNLGPVYSISNAFDSIPDNEEVIISYCDLGIAAIANTFNVLFQLVGAKASTEYLKQSSIRSFFQSKTMEKVPGTNIVTSINYADIYDEDGVFKSELS